MEEKFVETKSGNLYYLHGGEGSKILFLHGGIATPKAYLKLLNLLSDNYEVIAPTHPGHGKSFAIPESFTIDEYINIYSKFLNSINFNPQVIIGHSFGGMLALLLGRLFPQSQIIAMDACGLPLSLTPNEYIAFMTQEAKNLLQQRPDLKTISEIIPAAGTLVDTVVRHPENLSWLSEHVTTFDMSKQLSEIKNQVVLVWGANDGIVPLSNAHKMKSLMINSKLKVLPASGHVYVVTDTNLTFQTIQAELKSWCQN